MNHDHLKQNSSIMHNISGYFFSTPTICLIEYNKVNQQEVLNQKLLNLCRHLMQKLKVLNG